MRTLYAALISIAPTLGAHVAYAVAVGRLEGPLAGLTALDTIPEEAVRRFQPAWAVRAQLLFEAGSPDEAVAAYDKAISLTTHVGERAYLERRRADARSGT